MSMQHTNSLLCGGIDSSCHVLLSNGKTKALRDLNIHDTLMAEDGSQLSLLQTPLLQEENVFLITPIQSEPFYLSTQGSLRVKARCGSIRDHCFSIPAVKLLCGPRKEYKMYRHPMAFSTKELLHHPYVFGFWLGHGSTNSHSIYRLVHPKHTSERQQQFKPAFEYIEECCGCQVQVDTNQHAFVLKNYNKPLFDQVLKHIPNEYKFSSIEQRRELLAGIMDSCGHAKAWTFDVTTVNEQLADDIYFVALSLGIKANKIYNCLRKLPKKRAKMNSIRVLLSGKMEDIPCKTEASEFQPRQYLRDLNVFGFKIEPTSEVKEVAWLQLDRQVPFLTHTFLPC